MASVALSIIVCVWYGMYNIHCYLLPLLVAPSIIIVIVLLYYSQAVDSGILLLRDLNQPGLPLLNTNNHNTVLDTDSTDASTSQSPLTTHRLQANNLPRRPHMYESIDDFGKPNGRRSSSLSRDATPPIATNAQPLSIGTPKLSAGRRIR